MAASIQTAKTGAASVRSAVMGAAAVRATAMLLMFLVLPTVVVSSTRKLERDTSLLLVVAVREHVCANGTRHKPTDSAQDTAAHLVC